MSGISATSGRDYDKVVQRIEYAAVVVGGFVVTSLLLSSAMGSGNHFLTEDFFKEARAIGCSLILLYPIYLWFGQALRKSFHVPIGERISDWKLNTLRDSDSFPEHVVLFRNFLVLKVVTALGVGFAFPYVLGGGLIAIVSRILD